MQFKVWYQEWEGNKFIGTSDEFVNTPDKWPNSKWQGKGYLYNTPGDMNKVEKMFKLKPTYKIKKNNI